jgi:hypothetical protein
MLQLSIISVLKSNIPTKYKCKGKAMRLKRKGKQFFENKWQRLQNMQRLPGRKIRKK